MRTGLALLLLALALRAEDFVVFREAGQGPREQLIRYLNAVADRQLRERERVIAAIRTRQQAEERQKIVRQKILRLIGGLPETRGPLNVRRSGALEREGYRIEKIIYESLPKFYVPANVYVPTRATPPFPAILMPVGHGVDGKAGQRQIAVGLALKGFVVLAYDPVGQGERVQYFDPDLRASRVGGPTAEHSHASGHTMLIGDNVARYRIWDGMRGIDYLVERSDVDRERIGCTGCSGGGTLTTYISALDERVKAAAPACYITSWRELLARLGPQDAEQSFPGFLAEGLDMADYIELFAPKPWLILSTIGDYFPLEGARQTWEEARRWYRLYGAADRIGWHVGPGGHGTPQPSREAIYEWFQRWLQKGEGDPAEPAAAIDPPHALIVTTTGQVADSLGGETVFSLNKRRAADLILSKRTVTAADVRALASITVQPGGPPPPIRSHRRIVRDGYSIEVVSFEVERDLAVSGLILAPETAGVKPAMLVLDSRSRQAIAAPGGDLEQMVRAGYLVLAILPRGMAETAAAGRNPVLGDYALAMRAAVVGRNLAGMRAEDVIRAVDYLVSRPEVDRGRIHAFGQGEAAVPLLHAAYLDGRIGRLILQEALASWRAAVDRPVHRGLYSVAIPGVLRKYDLDDLAAALAPRRVTILNPLDALGKPIRVDRGPRDPLAPYLQP